MTTAHLVIVEDHGLFAQTVAVALEAHGLDVTVVEAATTHDIPEAALDPTPDAILLDLDLGNGRSSLDLVAPLAASGAPVTMLTGVTDPIRLARCVHAGAVGIIDKSCGFDELLTAVGEVLTEGTLLSDHDRQEHLARLRAHETDERRRRAPFEQLTAREAEVLAALMEGRSVDNIADEATVAVSTVRTQVRAILSKLGVKSQMAAVALARRARWSPQDR